MLRDKLLTQGLQGNFVTDVWTATAVETLCQHLVAFDTDIERRLPERDFTLLNL
ncbi:MAG: hypothetical protein KDI63_10860 [Gammaproteobacteria bacterium]|nr:hypothetical protein [Gammaproteobacteria bacterium]